MAEVIVIGAGLADLGAAAALARAGVDIVVLEARARVGGRVWSESLQTPHGDAAVIERAQSSSCRGTKRLKRLPPSTGSRSPKPG